MVGTFSEILGREVNVPEAPRRIVSFSPAITETLFKIGLGDRVVGVSAFCARPVEARLKRKIGSYNTVSPQLLDELDPDLIMTVTGYQRDFAVNLSQRYPVYPLELPVSVAGIVDMVVKVGLVTGKQEASRELASSLLVEAGAPRHRTSLTTYVEIDLGGPVTFGAHSYITDAIRLLGNPSLYEKERVEWVKPNLEFVKDQDPDVILYEAKMFSKFGRVELEALVGEREWNSLRSVRTGNLLLTPGPLDFLAHHGPAFITEVLPWLEENFNQAAERVSPRS